MSIEERLKSMIFSILVKKGSNHLVHLGTGYFIGYNGLFFSCGHTIRKIENELNTTGFKNLFIGFSSRESSLHKIISLKYDSKEIYLQKGPVYKDYSIGLIDINNEDFLVFNRKRPTIGANLRSLGLYNTVTSRLHPFENDTADLSGIMFNETNHKVSNHYPIISDLPKDFAIPRDEVNPSRIFNNCIEISETLFKGESGCPVIDDIGLVSGTFIASSKLNSKSVMVAGKNCTKTIKYRTNYKYDFYQDLPIRMENNTNNTP